jgi:hypothetical protein
MILHLGERVYWGAPDVIYLEGAITRLDDATQTVTMKVDGATSNAAHLVGDEIPFAADGLSPLRGESPAGLAHERGVEKQDSQPMSDAEKIRSAAAVAVYQKYGAGISQERRSAMIDQVAQVLEGDQEMRARIIQSMDQVLLRERR